MQHFDCDSKKNNALPEKSFRVVTKPNTLLTKQLELLKTKENTRVTERIVGGSKSITIEHFGRKKSIPKISLKSLSCSVGDQHCEMNNSSRTSNFLGGIGTNIIRKASTLSRQSSLFISNKIDEFTGFDGTHSMDKQSKLGYSKTEYFETKTEIPSSFRTSDWLGAEVQLR